MKKVVKNNKGFSLVELIVVIAIMAVLVGVLAPQFMKYVESSRQSTDIDNVQSLKTAIETEATEQLLTGTYTITINKSAQTATSSLAVTTMNATVKLKSAGWRDATYTYDASTGAWDFTAGAANEKNNTGKNLDSVFEDSKAVTTTTPSTEG
jgi:type IV pilus assembly protein PilA